VSVAPYQAHLVLVPGQEARRRADRLYDDLRANGVEAIYDDREERAGVKLMDADLIGAPLRLTVGDRGLAKGGVEMKHRRGTESSLVPLAEVPTRVREEIAALERALAG